MMDRRRFIEALAKGVMLVGAAGCEKLLSPVSELGVLPEQPAANRLLPDPREAVVAECLLAVMGWDWDVDRQIDGNAAGDWNYLFSDLNAYRVMKDRYGQNSSLWPVFYTDPEAYGFSGGFGRCGQCPYFTNLILFRSSVFQGSFPTYAQGRADYDGPRRFTKPVSKSRIGDIIRTRITNGHTAIVVKLMAGGYGGAPVTAVDVVDSNFIGNEIIGRHVIAKSGTGSGVGDLDNYYAIDLIKLGGR